MTYQVKEGDVLEYRGDGEWTSFHTLTVGKKYTTKKDAFGLYIVSDTGAHVIAAANFPKAYGFHLVTTPPATIQHEGYNYTRGEPVVPEWVKDGTWVVEKETGDVMCLSISKHAVKAVNMNGQLKWYGSDKKTASVRFRPFTNADWKWGMWAEYKGERVFVCAKAITGVAASRPSASYFFIPFSELTPTTAP